MYSHMTAEWRNSFLFETTNFFRVKIKIFYFHIYQRLYLFHINVYLLVSRQNRYFQFVKDFLPVPSSMVRCGDVASPDSMVRMLVSVLLLSQWPQATLPFKQSSSRHAMFLITSCCDTISISGYALSPGNPLYCWLTPWHVSLSDKERS